MNVVFVSTLLPETNYFKYLAKALEEAGVGITVYADKKEENKKTDLRNIKLVWSKSIFYPIQIVKELLKESNVDLIHLHHEINMFGGPVTALLYPILLFVLWLHKIKIVTTIHAVVSPEQINEDFLETFAFPSLSFLVWPVKVFFSFLYWLIGYFSCAVIVHTPSLKNYLIKYYNVPESKISVIPHGVPEDVPEVISFPDSPVFAGLQTNKFACYFGYFHRRKGLEYVLEAFSRVSINYPDFRLVLAGGTLQKDYEQALKDLVAKLGLVNRVVFTGFVSQKELYWLLKNSLFVLQPSTYSIAASGPLAQVIAFEKPVLGNDIGVFAEEITDGETGLLALARSSCDMSVKLEALIKDDSLRQKISQGLSRLHQERAWDKIAHTTKNLYQYLLEH